MVERYKDFRDFQPKTQAGRFTTYDLDYDSATSSLRGLEQFGEGTYSIGPIKVTREYVEIDCFHSDTKKGYGDKYTFYTRVENTEVNPICQIGLVHGFCESSDSFLEQMY